MQENKNKSRNKNLNLMRQRRVIMSKVISKKTRKVILLDKQVMQLNVREIVTQIAMKQIVVMRVEMISR